MPRNPTRDIFLATVLRMKSYGSRLFLYQIIHFSFPTSVHVSQASGRQEPCGPITCYVQCLADRALRPVFLHPQQRRATEKSLHVSFTLDVVVFASYMAIHLLNLYLLVHFSFFFRVKKYIP